MEIGIALSGGAARGLVHLGILKALEELQISLSIIAGTSSGAIMGALYAYGYPPDEILQIVINTKLFKLIRPGIGKSGLLKMDAAEKVYLQYFPENSFSALEKKLIVTTIDLNTGKLCYFSEGELIKPLMASSSLPIIFAPVQIGNAFYIDGGLLNNLPVEPLLDKCDKIIGAHCNPISEEFTARGFKAIFERTFLLIINSNTFESRKYCDLFIEPPSLGQFSILDLAKAQEIFEIGYQYTLGMQPQLEALRGATFQ